MHYALNCGQYVLHCDGKPVGPLHDEIAFCLDASTGTRHKFGAPDLVRAWHTNAQAKFRAANLSEMADELVVVQGRFTLEDINKVIDCSGYAAVLYQKVMNGTADVLDLEGNIIHPSHSIH